MNRHGDFKTELSVWRGDVQHIYGLRIFWAKTKCEVNDDDLLYETHASSEVEVIDVDIHDMTVVTEGESMDIPVDWLVYVGLFSVVEADVLWEAKTQFEQGGVREEELCEHAEVF